jgi:hypothetical protein
MNMKKVLSILMVAVALMMAAPAQAQLIKFGVKGGMNFSKLDTDVKSWYDAKENSTGFFVGPMAEITLPIIGLGIDGALLYSQRGDGEVEQQGLEVPVNLKYTIGLGSMLGFYVAAGPDFFFNFKDIKESENLKKEDSQVAINLGAGFKLLRKLQIGITYQIPLKDSHYWTNISLAPGAKASDTGARQKTWQASLAYIF